MKEIQSIDLKQKFIKGSGYLEKFATEVERDTRLFQIAAGDFIVEERKKPNFLFYLVKGRAKLYATQSNGRITLIDFFNAPCFIGEIELVDTNHDSLAVQSIEECWCLALPVKSYRSKLNNDVIFLRTLCIALGLKNSRNIISLTQNQSYPLANRLASFILLTQNKELYNEKHIQVAEYMGVSYRHLLYVIAQFTRDEILVRDKRGYRINNKESLVKLSHEMGNDD